MKIRVVLVALVAAIAVPAAHADPAKVGYPSSIASTGDSITRAFNTCGFDRYAAYNLVFTTCDVTTRDYFHPSVSGQAKAAAVAWTNSFDYTDQTAPVSTAVVSGGLMSVTATDNVAVSGIEYRFAGGSWTRYTGPVALAVGQAVDVRAVDVNGNIEASHTITG